MVETAAQAGESRMPGLVTINIGWVLMSVAQAMLLASLWAP